MGDLNRSILGQKPPKKPTQSRVRMHLHDWHTLNGAKPRLFIHVQLDARCALAPHPKC